ncbi:hypothetical protein [Nocardia sp. XZ_19_385]|uniref:hypothetical protein n=1 Tax=Nocardia sp. XZ_19_385 TaxID=2769488 RepID=UPI00188F43B2|nr:hypothetical protein [Nocardia sp. XZ_19_385]
MIGWMIYLHRQADNRMQPATRTSESGTLAACWQGGLGATRWLHDLVASGSAIDLGGDGYPSLMTARAGAVIPVVSNGPPYENRRWVVGAEDIVDKGWVGKTIYKPEVADACDDDEWLLVTIWDES